MDYFRLKDFLRVTLICFYGCYFLIILVRRFILTKKSTQIIKIPVTRNNLKNISLIILTYIVIIPIFSYYFGKVLRLFYCQFVVVEDHYLRREGFFLDEYDTRQEGWIFCFYFFLIIKLIFGYAIRNYTIRKENFILISVGRQLLYFFNRNYN